MAKKPKHDPLTAWSTSAAPALTTGHLQRAYQYLMAPAAGGWGYPAPPAKTVKWTDMAVGEIYRYAEIDFEGEDPCAEATLGASVGYCVRILVSDGSEGTVAYPDGITPFIHKTKAGRPPKSPDDIEETTELIIGWRTFSVENFKLRGVWSVWHERVFHASCNCKEYTEATIGIPTGFQQTFETKDERREQMRQHLASGKGTCGVYSRSKLSYLRDVHGSGHSDRGAQVAAKVVNYGLGYEYDDGFRSEYSRLEHLYLLETRPVSRELATGKLHLPFASDVVTYQPETVAQTLSTTYGVPCDVMHPLEFMWKHEVGML